MTAADDPVALEIAGGVATVRLNRPAALNAIDEAAAERFLAAMRVLQERDDIRAIVLRGEGRGFCGGGDVARFVGEAEEVAATILSMMRPMHEALLVMAALPAPSVARVHGVAAGAGISLMLACDFAIASQDTRFAPGYARLGTSPDLGLTWRLSRIAGERKAKEIALLADPFDAAEALRLGLVNGVVPASELDAAVSNLVGRLAAGPTRAFGRIRALLDGAPRATLAEQLEAEEAAFLAASRTVDFGEGVAAFLGKRATRFEGR